MEPLISSQEDDMWYALPGKKERERDILKGEREILLGREREIEREGEIGNERQPDGTQRWSHLLKSKGGGGDMICGKR